MNGEKLRPIGTRFTLEDEPSQSSADARRWKTYWQIIDHRLCYELGQPVWREELRLIKREEIKEKK